MNREHDEVRIPLWLADQLIETLVDESDKLHFRAGQMSEDDQKSVRQRADALSALKGALWNAKHEQHPPHWRNGGSNVDQRGASGNSSIVQMESNRLLPWLMLSTLLCGLSIGISFLAISDAKKAERETKLLREDVRVMSIALARRGIDTNEHSTETGESK